MSRYSKLQRGEDEAKVARVIIQYEPVSAFLNDKPVPFDENGVTYDVIFPGDVLKYDFKIRNFSGAAVNQVLMKYRIVVNLEPEPQLLPVVPDIIPKESYTSAGDEWTYMGYQNPETHEYSLIINWPEEQNQPEYHSKQQALSIKIESVQVNSY